MPSSTSSTDEPPAQNHPMRTRAMDNIIQQRKLTDGTIMYPIPRVLPAESPSTLGELTCFSNVITVLEWWNAMQVEFNALLQNQTWVLVPPVFLECCRM
jgi:hypothetical protein